MGFHSSSSNWPSSLVYKVLNLQFKCDDIPLITEQTQRMKQKLKNCTYIICLNIILYSPFKII